MYFSQTLALVALAVTSATALTPPTRPNVVAKPAKPVTPTFNAQTINCGGGAAPYCCSPSTSNANSGGLMTEGNQSGGTTCSKMSGSSVNCNAFVICCNNNGVDASQSCSASVSALQQPVVIV